MNATLLIAGKELREGMRNRWALAAAILLAALALAIAFLGSAPTGAVAAGRIDVVVVSLASLGTFVVPLLGLLLAHDAIVGEVERGTMQLLLSYPLYRPEIVAGKFLGHLAILALATTAGYGLAALALFFTGAAASASQWAPFFLMLGSSVLLGAVFLSLGYCISVLARSRGSAAGTSIAVWLLFVVLYDMVLLGLLVADTGQHFSAGVVDFLLLLNPTDSYRLLNLGGTAGAATAAGLAGIGSADILPRGILLLSLVFWVAGPLSIAGLIFSRREY